MAKNIHLGHKPDYSEPMAEESMEEEEHFPHVFIDGIDELKDLPEKGSITFEYELVERSERKHERNGKTEVTTTGELKLTTLVEAKKKGAEKKAPKTDREEVEEVFSELDE